jgi:hypothetical protein
MKYKFKKRLICEFATYMYKRKKKKKIWRQQIFLVQMLKCIGSFYWIYNNEYKSTVHVHVKVKYCKMCIFVILCVDETYYFIRVNTVMQ